MKVHTLVISCILFLLTACEEMIDSSAGSNADLIVVEGILTNERINHRIKLTRPYNIQNGPAEPVIGADVRISDGDSEVTLTEFPFGSGEYYTPRGRAVFGKVYTLTFTSGGKTYSASDSAEPVEPLDAIQFQKQPDGYSLITHASGDVPNFINYELNWQNTSSCTGTCIGKVVFYDLKTVDVNEFYKPKDDTFVFPENTTIIRKKYSVSPAFKAYLRAMMSETKWRGGFFDVERDNVPTNLSPGATGFFGVSTVVSDTTIVQN